MRTPFMDALKEVGSVRKAADKLGVPRSTFFDSLNRERRAIELVEHAELPVIERLFSKPKYFIFTCAVRGAKVHEDFLHNLEAYADHLGAQLIIGPLTNHNRQRYADYSPDEFDPAVVPYISDEPLVIGDSLRFSPELNLTPSMVKPLQGLQTYTKNYWGIFPHTKISLETVPTHKDRPTKFIATTGAVTQPFYSPTKAGFRAHFDHVHGAIIVEAKNDGIWFRHLTPTNALDGTFYDLGLVVKNGVVQKNKEGVKALIYGDIHVEKLDNRVALATWGYGPAPSRKLLTPLVDEVKPQVQVLHDLLDMSGANYHEMDNMFRRYESWTSVDEADLAQGINDALDFLRHVETKSQDTVIVDSNHDWFIEKWLLKYNPTQREDFENIETYLRLYLSYIRYIRSGKPTSFLEMILTEFVHDLEDPKTEAALECCRFLYPDESLDILGVECGWHGHRGPNGRRGSKHAFKFVTEKATIGHMHSPSIESGCHTVGTSSQLDLGYNAGPSNWSHTHGIIYPHGGRALITMSNGKFWATQGL